MRSHDYLLFWEITQEVRWKQVGAELRLTHTWRYVDYDALFLAINHVLEYLSQLFVVGADFKPRVYPFGELNGVGLRFM